MFFLGSAFAFYVVIPLAFDFFLGFQQIGSAGEHVKGEGSALGDPGITFQGSVAEYLSLTIKFIVAFGLCFQLPVLLSLLANVGFVDSDYLIKRRKYVIVIIFVVAAILTPPDPITQIGLGIPLLILYELSILSVKIIEKRKKDA